MQTLRRAAILCAVLCFAVAGVAGEPAWAKKKKKNEQTATSDEMAEFGDAALGRMYHERIVELLGIYEHQELNDYVQQIGEDLASNAPGDSYEWHFTVLDDDMVNAFALPGGYIYITRGLLAHLNSEAQLAAVLGHEIGHVTSRHAARQHTAAKVVGKVTGSIATVPGGGGFNLGSLFGAGLVRGYGREMELEADQTGAELVARLGYDPQSMLEVIAILKARDEYETRRAGDDEQPSTYHAMLSSHPEKDRRTRELVAAATEMRASSARDAGNERYLAVLDGLAFAGSTEQGVLRENKFYHSSLDFALTFPEGWEIVNLPGGLVARPPDADGSLHVVPYPRGKRKRARVPVDQFVQKHLGMRRWQNPRTLDIGGNTAFLTIAPKALTVYGERRARVGAIYHGDLAYVFLGATEDTERQTKYDREFVATIESFRALNESERELAEPYRIRTIELSDGVGLAELAARSEFASESLLRLLNGLQPDDEPAAGTRIKYID